MMNKKIKEIEKLKIYALFGDYGRYKGKVSESRYFKVYFSQYLFENYFSLSDMYQNKLKINKATVQKLIDQIYQQNYDIIYCGDSCDAFLLQYIFKRNNLRPKNFLINEVDLFKRVKLIDELIYLYYHENFFEEFISSSYNHWFYTVPSRTKEYLNIGIKKINLHYVPLSMPNIELFFPEMCKVMIKSKKLEKDCEFKGKILSSGSHDRDYELLVKALDGLDVQANIICNIEAYKPITSKNVFWHNSLPEERYINAISSAKYIVLPLMPTERIAGQLNCAIAMYFGKIIIAPECKSLSEYLTDNETGILYKQGSVESLREKIIFVENHFFEIQFIGENAKRRERELSRIANKSIKRLADNIKFSLNGDKI